MSEGHIVSEMGVDDSYQSHGMCRSSGYLRREISYKEARGEGSDKGRSFYLGFQQLIPSLKFISKLNAAAHAESWYTARYRA